MYPYIHLQELSNGMLWERETTSIFGVFWKVERIYLNKQILF